MRHDERPRIIVKALSYLSTNHRRRVTVMENFFNRLLLCRVALLLGLVPALSQAQSVPPSSPSVDTGKPATTTSAEAAQLDAQREKIWNSREMLEARAHMDLYFKRSAQVTPEQAEKYMADLKAMSPDQMQMWLIQHQQQRAQVQQEQERWTNLRREAARGTLPAQNMGAFQNPLANRRTVSSGQPVAARPNPNAVTQRPIQKPFSGPQFSGAAQPLVTSEDVARAEILRGLGPWFVF